jgi:hypothetical protein
MHRGRRGSICFPVERGLCHCHGARSSGQEVKIIGVIVGTGDGGMITIPDQYHIAVVHFHQ